MKIAIIGPSYPYRGGIANFSDRLAKAFMDAGEDVTLFTFTLQYPGFLFPGKTQYSEEPPPPALKIIRCINAVNPLNWLLAGIKIRKWNPDIVVVKFWLPFMGPCLGTIVRVLKWNRRTKVICLVHNMVPHEKRPGDRIFTKYFVNGADAFLALSESVMQDVRRFDDCAPKAVSPHPLYDNFGKIADREPALQRLGLDPQYHYILFFGLIRQYKGLDLLLRAYADERFRKEKIRLIIAGEYYDDKEKYQLLIEELGLRPHLVQVDKFIPDSEVADYFNAADLVVQPYRSATQSGVTQIAYHFNKPMIVTNVGGLKAICPDGKTGYVVEPEPNAIADAILKFFHETDRILMVENIIGEKAKYSWDKLTMAIYSLAGKTDHR